jgi:S-adenosylmethionine hydrolase
MTSQDARRGPAPRSGLVTLLTDFGLVDSYVGQMKGVLHSLAPELRSVIDLTHGIPAQQVAVAAFQWETVWSYFPQGTVHVAVVDPGVGTARRILGFEREGHLFLCPDNGLASGLLAGARGLVQLDLERLSLPERSFTFHGRDVFAPAAARLVQGARIEDLGPALPAGDLPMLLDGFEASEAAGVDSFRLETRVLFLDRFGNAITRLPARSLAPDPGAWSVVLPGHCLAVRQTYGQVRSGEPLALTSSFGTLEVAVRDGDAGRTLGLGPGSILRLERRGQADRG